MTKSLLVLSFIVVVCGGLLKWQTSAIEFAGTRVHYSEGDFQVQVLRFLSTQASPESIEKKTTPAILIVPPTGGANVLDRSYARNLSSAGFDVYVLEHWTDDGESSLELEIHRRFYARAQRAIDLTLKHVESPFVGILGTSVGALHASVAMSTQDRLRAAFVIVGGTPIASVIAKTDQGVLVEARKKRFGLYNFKNTEDYVAALDQVLPLEPRKLPMLFKDKALGMVIADSDTVVPAQEQLQLKEFWNPQTIYEFSNNHFFAILKTWLFHRTDISQFFVDAQASMAPAK